LVRMPPDLLCDRAIFRMYRVGHGSDRSGDEDLADLAVLGQDIAHEIVAVWRQNFVEMGFVSKMRLLAPDPEIA